jgi:hypothetical protein
MLGQHMQCRGHGIKTRKANLERCGKNNDFTPNSLKRRGGEIIIGERGEGKK